jgi:hypothetical protein
VRQAAETLGPGQTGNLSDNRMRFADQGSTAAAVAQRMAELRMKEIEITEMPPLSPGELSMLDMHSVINVLNVLRCELTLLGMMAADDEDYFHEGVAICESLLVSLHEPEAALQAAARVEEFEHVVFTELTVKLDNPPRQPDPKEVTGSLENLRTVFTIMKVRAQEILARASAPERWRPIDLGKLHSDFLDFFSAIERNGKGRYRILRNAARKEPLDYYIDLRFETAGGAPLLLPPVFLDTMHDLVANARKYTAPGGDIVAALFEDARELRFVVSDTGRGIPEAELAQVVQFGKRASNVGDVRTMGGGFGLTKAFMVTKRFGGRFWIASELGRGTRIRIVIPRPAVASR